MIEKAIRFFITVLCITFIGCDNMAVLFHGQKPEEPPVIYTVTFNTNGASGTAPSTQTANAGSSIILPSGSELTKSSCSFGGWNTETDGTGITYNAGASYTVTTSITLYAKWNSEEVIVVPVGLTVTDTTSTSITLTWTALKNATKYKIYTSVTSTGNFWVVDETIDNVYIVYDLTPDSVYYYRVTSVDINGIESPQTAPIQGQTLPEGGSQKERQYIEELFSDSGSWLLPNDVKFPATVEVYALGAGGGGQGGHMYQNYYVLYVDTKTGTGGAGGGGAAAYMRFETNIRENFTINVGHGGTRGLWVMKVIFQDWEAGNVGGKGEDTTVTWSGGTLLAQGGQGGGNSANKQSVPGGAGGNREITKPDAITLANWESVDGDPGIGGKKDGKVDSLYCGGDSAALKLKKGWFDFSKDTDNYYGGGWLDFVAMVFYFPGTGGGGSGGWGENNGVAGGDGQVRIRVTWYE